MARAFDENKNVVSVADIVILTGQIDMTNVNVGFQGSTNIALPDGWLGENTHVLSISFHKTTSGAIKEQSPGLPFGCQVNNSTMALLPNRVIINLKRTEDNGNVYDLYVAVANVE